MSLQSRVGYREMSQYDRINVVSALDSAWEGLNSLLNVSRYYLLVISMTNIQIFVFDYFPRSAACVLESIQ